MPDLRLADGVERAIRRHGEETYPHECCGALVGRGTLATTAVPLPNTTEEGPRRRFLVRPSDYRLAERRASELGGELLGFYHSHPDHPARPSQYDLEHAWPTFAYVIVSVAAGAARLPRGSGEPAKAGEITVWFLKEDRTTFEEGTLHHGDENPDSDPAPAVHG
jgi:proteasome lid subunit RPN8/RPN11